MEPRHRAPQALRGEPAEHTPAATRVRLAAVCLVLTGVAFVQDPGFVVADTKLDLVLDPGRFLGRALQLWDPASAFGQLQNQAYGYLWPMGPFFWAGSGLEVPGWAVQRGWWALVLCTAFVGAALVVRALGVRSDLAVVVAGLAYALSPRMLTVLGPISIEAWPSALAPWVLLPLVLGAQRGSPRRYAALSALGVALVGGVNAAATFAVIPLGAVWLLTRTPGPRRRALMLWWPLFTLLGTLWWLVPLLTLGAYSPPFLDFIETSSITTYPTTVFDALRGTSNWVPYVSPSSRAGYDLISQGHLAVMSGVVVAAGLVGLLDRRQPHRWFLSLSLTVGLLMVTAGHQGAVQGLFAGGLAEALDGVLAPLRNVHKFDPVVRLPLVVGLAWTLQRLVLLRVRERDEGAVAGRFDRGVALGVVVLSVALAASPALAARLAPGGGFLDVPDYWRETGQWLARAEAEVEARTPGQPTRALLVPGSAFGEYVWGDPHDEPMQALARSEWAVRNQIPLTPPGGIRMLDRLEEQIAHGQGSVALADGLRRAGVRWLVVRGDLRPGPDLPDPVLVRQALADSPGLRPVEQLGPEVGGEAHLYDGETRIVVNGGWQAPARAIEVWEVAPRRAVATTTGTPTVVAGGPEDLLDLERLGVLGEGASVLAPDVPDGVLTGPLAGSLAGAPVVLTDGLRQRERSFARVHDGYSPATTPGDVRRTGNPTADYLSPAQEDWQTTVSLRGIRSVSASSSASDATATGGADRGRLPYAALDGDPVTQWSGDRGADPTADGPDRWSVRLTEARELGEIRLVGGQGADPRQQVRVQTASWRSEVLDLGPGQEAVVTVEDPRSSGLEVVQAGTTRTPMALAEVDLGGPETARILDLPRLPRAWGAPDAVVLRADLDPRHGCVEIGQAVRCTPTQVRSGEEDGGLARRFALPQDATYAAALRVRPRPGAGLAQELVAAQPVAVTASSTAVPDPRASALAAVDGQPGTAWVADADDLVPELRLGWLEPQRLTGLSIDLPDDTPAARPTTLRLVWPGGRRVVELDEDGEAELPAIRTTQLRVQLLEIEQAVDLDFDSSGETLPGGIAELSLSGSEQLPLTPSREVVPRPCGSGPVVSIAGTDYPTQVLASDAQLLAGQEVEATLCGDDGAPVEELALAAGEVEVASRPAEAFELSSLVLTDPAAALGAPETAAPGLVPATEGLLALRHNDNPGWTARQGEETLTPVVVDGWRQAWQLRSTAPVERGFAPDAVYRGGLLAGALALLVLLAVVARGAVARARRAPERLVASPALRPRRPRPVATVATAALAGALLAGAPGLLVGLVTAGLLAATRRWPVVTTAAPATLVLVAASAYLVRPWGGFSGWAGDFAWPHYLALVPVLGALVLAGWDAHGQRAPRHLIEGRSTSR